MRLAFSLLVVCFGLLLAGYQTGRPGLAAGTTQGPAMELLVFEHPQCTYCEVFRRNVLPKYHIANRISAPPVKFIDVASTDIGSLRLDSGIRIVPTAVVMRDGREVGRIEGYWSSANFFQMLAHILDAAS